MADSASHPILEARARDRLTLLLTRRAFLAEIAQRMQDAPFEPVALLVVDVNAFHEINAAFGVAVGDGVLRNTARRIAATLTEGECAGRMGGDEFGLFISGAARVAQIDRLSDLIHETLDPPMLIGGHRISFTTSIGAARRETPAMGAEALVNAAGAAMREAKTESRRSFRMHSSTRRTTLHSVRDWRELQDAVTRNELSLVFQPIFNAKTLHMSTAEVLVRWMHKEKGAIPPSEFIQLAERSGLIIELGAWVLDQSIQMLARHDGLRLAVNVSPLQFRQHGFALKVQELLHVHRVAPDRLEVEITESAMISESDVAERTLRQLRDVGVRVALDDFGAGFSSLSYLQRLAFDKLKLDQTFVRGIGDKSENSRLLRSIIDLGHSLGLTVVAEGVENKMQAGLLQLLGCDLLQGYALSVPLDEKSLYEQFLAPEPNPETVWRASKP